VMGWDSVVGLLSDSSLLCLCADESSAEMWREARAGVSIFMLLGVSWIFGALINTGDGGSSLTFQYVFAITTTLQGFGVFLLYCLGSPQVCVSVCECEFFLSLANPALAGHDGVPAIVLIVRKRLVQEQQHQQPTRSVFCQCSQCSHK
jgi:hypothetical protein